MALVTRFVLDTNCMVAALCAWHQHHEAAAQAIEERLARGEEPVSVAPALVETYSVLTRLPAPHRLAPTTARTLVHSNFIKGKRVIAPTAETLCELIYSAPERGIKGGHTYDAVIATCVIKAKAATLLTFNEKHFRSLDLAEATVSVPGS